MTFETDKHFLRSTMNDEMERNVLPSQKERVAIGVKKEFRTLFNCFLHSVTCTGLGSFIVSWDANTLLAALSSLIELLLNDVQGGVCFYYFHMRNDWTHCAIPSSTPGIP